VINNIYRFLKLIIINIKFSRNLRHRCLWRNYPSLLHCKLHHRFLSTFTFLFDLLIFFIYQQFFFFEQFNLFFSLFNPRFQLCDCIIHFFNFSLRCFLCVSKLIFLEIDDSRELSEYERLRVVFLLEHVLARTEFESFFEAFVCFTVYFGVENVVFSAIIHHISFLHVRIQV